MPDVQSTPIDDTAKLADVATTSTEIAAKPPLSLSRRARADLYNYAAVTGWAASAESRRPIGPDGEPLPWYTYPAIYFLTRRIKREMRVFEYGSGNSTLWWASRVVAVTSCEHHEGWFAEMSPKVPANVSYMQRNLENGQYANALLEKSDLFDIIVIDGRDRVACASAALQRLTDDGVIVWDNSNRGRYRPAYVELDRHGFRRLPFKGHGPISKQEWETSIFYRPANCLGL